MRVLLVEDNEAHCRLMAAFLTQAGCLLELAGNGREAVLAVARAQYDLVLMDLRLPEMDGLEAARRIRALPPPRCSVQILAVTAEAVAGIEERCRAAGMDGYFPKPVSFARLETRLQALRAARRTGNRVRP